jgi:hypothetical protein
MPAGQEIVSNLEDTHKAAGTQKNQIVINGGWNTCEFFEAIIVG